jgi:hypothetical protein
MDFSFKADDIEKKEDSLVSLPQLQSDEEKARYERRTMYDYRHLLEPRLTILQGVLSTCT